MFTLFLKFNSSYFDNFEIRFSQPRCFLKTRIRRFIVNKNFLSQVKHLNITTNRKSTWILCLTISFALALTPRMVRADENGDSGGGGSGGAVVGAVLVGLIVWALFGRNSDTKKEKKEEINNSNSTLPAEPKEVPPPSKGTGSVTQPEF